MKTARKALPNNIKIRYSWNATLSSYPQQSRSLQRMLGILQLILRHLAFTVRSFSVFFAKVLDAELINHQRELQLLIKLYYDTFNSAALIINGNDLL